MKGQRLKYLWPLYIFKQMHYFYTYQNRKKVRIVFLLFLTTDHLNQKQFYIIIIIILQSSFHQYIIWHIFQKKTLGLPVPMAEKGWGFANIVSKVNVKWQRLKYLWPKRGRAAGSSSASKIDQLSGQPAKEDEGHRRVCWQRRSTWHQWWAHSVKP